MKTKTTLFFLLAFGASSIAQNYTSQSFSNPVYSNVQLGATDYVDFSQATGQNQTWDLTADGIISESIYSPIEVNTAAGNENYPDANYAMSVTTDGQELVLYFEISSSLISEVGFYSEFGMESLGQTYTDAKDYFSFPLSYGDSGSDTFAGENELPGGIVQQVSGNIAYEVVGSGTVITNAGTFENALLVLSSETSTAIIEVAGMQFETVTTSETYDFFLEGFPAPIASMSTFETSTLNGVESDEEGFVLMAATTNLPSIDLSSISVYPNPAQNFLNISLEKVRDNVNVNILDLNGKTVLSQVLREKQTRLQLDGLSSGVYVVLVQQGDEVLRERLVVE